MPPQQRRGVFLSYARADENLAASIRDRLRGKAPDIALKQDRLLLEGGVGWWQQLTDAIDSVEFLILVMTPSAMQSEMVRKEWRYARQQGVCVYPVKGAPDSQLNFGALPPWMRKAHFYDLDKEWDTLVAHLQRGCNAPRVPFRAPDLPPHFVRRTAEFTKLKDLLLSRDRKEPVAITTALAGGGGFGKTTLAAALCHDEDIMESFDDGILWVTLGQDPDVLGGLASIYAALSGERPNFAGLEDAKSQVVERLGDRTCLLVIDDVWDPGHLRPFLEGGPRCARLFTTRNAIIAASAQRVDVDEMSGAEAVAMIASAAPAVEVRHARELAQRLGEWPLALELARSIITRRIANGDTAERAAQHVLTMLDRGGLGQLRNPGAAEARFRTIGAVLSATLDALGAQDAADIERVRVLSIFPGDEPIPLAQAGALWGLADWQAEECGQRIADLSLAKLDLGRGTLRVHDVVAEWLASGLQDAAAVHGKLLDAWPDFHHLTSSYQWRWAAWHLIRAGRMERLRELLFDADWVQRKLDATDVNALIADYEHLRGERGAGKLQGALRLSAHVLARDKGQLWSQLAGRIGMSDPDCGAMIRGFRSAGAAGLIPQAPTSTGPGNAELRTLAGHTGMVIAVAVYAEGTRAISASGDRTLKVWNLETGTEVRTLAGHRGPVTAVAVYREGTRAISASHDGTLKVWDLETGTESRTLAGHTNGVSAVAVYRGGTYAISASDDGTLKVWDLEAGTELRTLAGHTRLVYSVAVYGEGTRAISASGDRTLKVWDLETGTELRTLAGHTDWVGAVAVYGEGTRAISASGDGNLKVWDLETGTELHTIAGHTGPVSAVAVYREGARAISASWTGTLKVWDLETGTELRTLAGHTDWVGAVAVYGEGTHAISASSDGTLKVWDLDTGAESRTLTWRTDRVRALVVYSEGTRAISVSLDRRLRAWDLETGTELRTLSGHLSWVDAVAVYGDGTRAISTSWDRTLRVWDLETGTELHTIAGHTGAVLAVAVYGRGTRAITGSSDQTLKVWDLETGSELRTLEGHTKRVVAVAVYVRGTRAISASDDGTLKVWSLEMGSELCTLAGHIDQVRAVAVYGGGTRAVSASSDQTLKVWDLETGAEVRTLTGHTKPVSGVVVYGEGTRAISASWDRTLKVWDLETGTELRTFAGHTGGVSAMAVYVDGRRAISASYDRTLKVWDLQTGRTVATYNADAPITCCAIGRGSRIVAGDGLGRVHFLDLVEPELVEPE